MEIQVLFDLVKGNAEMLTAEEAAMILMRKLRYSDELNLQTQNAKQILNAVQRIRAELVKARENYLLAERKFMALPTSTVYKLADNDITALKTFTNLYTKLISYLKHAGTEPKVADKVREILNSHKVRNTN